MRAKLAAALILALATTATPTHAQTPAGSAWTYQGQLEASGVPLNCFVDLRCSLFDAASGGNQQCSTIQRDGINVVQGRFTINLDFGAGMFNGDARWLEMQVRYPASTGSWTTLSPRPPTMPTHYAIRPSTRPRPPRVPPVLRAPQVPRARPARRARPVLKGPPVPPAHKGPQARRALPAPPARRVRKVPRALKAPPARPPGS